MLPYWLLFALFAVGAFRFMTVRTPTQPSASSPQVPPAPVARSPGDQALILASLVPALMIGLRYQIGADWFVYVDIFEEIRRRGLEFGFSRIDPGYALVNWVAGAAGFDIWLVNIICGLLIMYGLVKFARLQPHPWLAVAVAVPYLVIVVGMGYSRQAVAIGLCMAGLAAIGTSGSFTRFVFWVLAGALFHRSAAILIPIVAIAYSRNRFQAVVIGLVGSAAGYYMLALGQGLEHFHEGYIATARQSQGAGFRLAMNLPPAVVFLGFANRFTTNPTDRRIWITFSAIALLSFAAWMFIASSTALDRIALYIIPLQIFVLSRLPTALSTTGKTSGLLAFVVITYSALVEFVWLNYSNNAFAWLPYRLFPLV